MVKNVLNKFSKKNSREEDYEKYEDDAEYEAYDDDSDSKYEEYENEEYNDDEYPEDDEQYADDCYDDYPEEYSEDDRAYFRHQRRTRTTAIVWSVTIALVVVILFGAGFGVYKLMNAFSSQSEANELRQQLQELEEQNSEDEPLEIETPEE